MERRDEAEEKASRLRGFAVQARGLKSKFSSTRVEVGHGHVCLQPQHCVAEMAGSLGFMASQPS